MHFLESLFQVKRDRFRFGLQIFGDMDERLEKAYWVRVLGVNSGQFYKTVITPHRGVGNYREKTKHGVITIYFNNKKLRDILSSSIENLSV